MNFNQLILRSLPFSGFLPQMKGHQFVQTCQFVIRQYFCGMSSLPSAIILLNAPFALPFSTLSDLLFVFSLFEF